MSARCAFSFVWYCPSGNWRGWDIPIDPHPSVVSPHKPVGLCCGSGKLTKLESLELYGNFAGTIPTEM
jgi:hypothetical protein